MKKIIVCFDGTGNEPGDAEQNKQEAIEKDNSISNVLKIHLLLGGNIENNVSTIIDQVSLYYPGVGVRGNFFKRLWRQAFAAKGPEVIINEAFDDLKQHYEKNDSLYIFGFSRGAAIARMFACLLKNGIETKSNGKDAHPNIELLGVFDTVAAIGKPNLRSNYRPVSDVVFENRKISPIIKNAVHLVSLDENRLAFRPTLMNFQQNVTEVWFPGVHSDIGGGYYNDGLSDIALEYMISKAKLNGLEFLSVDDLPETNLMGKDHNNDDIKIDKAFLQINSDCNAQIHCHDEKWRKAFTKPREADVMQNDVPSRTEKIKVHQSVFDRKKKDSNYDPMSLRDIDYTVVNE